MNLMFYVARLTGNQDRLAEYSVPEPALLGLLAGRSVAIVGNARALSDTTQGAEIDAADVVIRLNSAPMPSERSHGSKTDWLAISTPVSDALIAERQATHVLWMTNVRKRLPLRIAQRPGFYLNRDADWQALRDQLASRPTTGLMIIDLVARSNARSIALHGFDFFSSLSLSGRRTDAQVPHDFGHERAFVESLIANDPRVHLTPM